MGGKDWTAAAPLLLAGWPPAAPAAAAEKTKQRGALSINHYKIALIKSKQH